MKIILQSLFSICDSYSYLYLNGFPKVITQAENEFGKFTSLLQWGRSREASLSTSAFVEHFEDLSKKSQERIRAKAWFLKT